MTTLLDYIFLALKITDYKQELQLANLISPPDSGYNELLSIQTLDPYPSKLCSTLECALVLEAILAKYPNPAMKNLKDQCITIEDNKRSQLDKETKKAVLELMDIEFQRPVNQPLSEQIRLIQDFCVREMCQSSAMSIGRA
jgi:hypothetical protein